MTSNENNSTKSDKTPYIVVNVLFGIIAVLAFFVGKNYDIIFNKSEGSNPNNNTVVSIDSGNKEDNDSGNEENENQDDVIVRLIGDKRCENCQTSLMFDSLKELELLSGAEFEESDFSDKGMEELLKANDIKTLPAVLINTNNFSDAQFTQFLQETPSGLYSLNVGADFDPFAEICNNEIDDNGDGNIDCEDETCKKEFACAPKVNKPIADLYIMSYCPYGLQAQKGYLEVMSKLSNVADINIKFVPYLMHGQKEADENVVQYCIQKNEKEKYISYLECFLAEGENEACREKSGIDEIMLSTCIDETKQEFQIDEEMAKQSETNPYPSFLIDETEADEAGVEGSPTFVVNGIKIEKAGRNAKAYADLICSTFKEKPSECDEDFADTNFDPSFGFTSNGVTTDAGCGQ